MECEICGRQVSDNPKRAKIEGSVMNVLSLEKYKKHLQNQNLENQTNLRKIKKQDKITLKMNQKKN